MTWHRIVLPPDDNLVRFLTMGDRLSFAGLLRPGISIWRSDATVARLAEIRGGQPTHAYALPSGVTEIYLSPGTRELLEGDLAGYTVEPCARPNEDDVGLLVGDQGDWDRLFR